MREQHGQIVYIGDRWFVRYWERRNVGGILKRQRVSFLLGPRTSRAQRPPIEIVDAAADHMKAVKSSKIPAEMIVTVADFAERVYLPFVAKHQRPSTCTAYRQLWRQHLAPIQECSGKVLKDVETHDCQKWLDTIMEAAAHPLSQSVLRHCKFVLSGLFRLAEQQGYYRTGINPVRACRTDPRATKPKPTFAYNSADISRLLILLPEPSRTIVATAAFTAARIGEIEALEWTDLRDGCLFITRSVWRGRINEAKTASSIAPVPVVKRLAAMLELHRQRTGNPAQGPIFRTSLGTRLSMGNVLRDQILPLCNRCAICKRPKGVRHLRPADRDDLHHDWQRDATVPRWLGWHGFRRGVATTLQHNGANLTLAQAALRHGDSAVTSKHYTKVARDDVRSALEMFSDGVDIVDSAVENTPQDTYGTVNAASGTPPELVN